MIDKLRSMAIFATVVERGTFRAAALHLNLAPSRISQAVSDLEKDLGITLLYRSTRQMSLTSEGQLLYAKVREMLQAAETGLDAINLLSSEPAGELRVTAPAFITQTGMMDLFSDFAKAYPGVDLKFDFSDQPRDMIKDGFDVAIRAGLLKDSDLMSRTIGHAARIMVASPEYAVTRNTPTEPSHLEQWDWLHFAMRPERTELISPAGETTSFACRYHIEVDSVYALYEFAVRGLGLTIMPEHLAQRSLRQGELVHVMPEWSVAPLVIHAVWPDRSRRESLTLIFVRFLAEHAKTL